MADAALTSVVQYLRRTVAGPQEQTDGQLLERFLRQREEAAFTTLLQRHGPMVLGVCRRLLGHDAAEDAFQATWLVLLRRAGSIRKREALGGWLYGVAYRTALKARAEAARRGLLERPLLEVPAAPAVSNLGAAELRAQLDAEVCRLARRYRAPVVLCYFQNKTYTEAAQILGIAAGTVASRLARARELLRARLTRRGLTLSAGLLATLLSQERLTAALPDGLVEASRRAVVSILAGRPWSAVVPANILTLTKRVLKTMFLTKLTTITVVVVLLGLAGAGAMFVSSAAAARQADDEREPAAEIQALRTELQQAKQENKQLKEELRRVQQSARQAPFKLYRGKPTSHWIEQLNDGDPSYRKEAVTVLGVISQDDPSVIEPLLRSLRDKDETVQLAAVGSLNQSGPPAVPPLTALLKEEGRIRVLAALALRYHHQDAKPAIPALINLLRSKDLEARRAAIQAFTGIGPIAKDAIPALVQVLKGEPNVDMQMEVFTALMQVEPATQGLCRRFFNNRSLVREALKETPEWQRVIEELEKKYPVPSRKATR
jgi:RNA polymerase sigma factor (sigma-70 family)